MAQAVLRASRAAACSGQALSLWRPFSSAAKGSDGGTTDDSIGPIKPYSKHRAAGINRRDFYHRRHKAQKRKEKAAAPLEFWKDELKAAEDSKEKPDPAAVAAIQQSIDTLTSPWTLRNMPVTPPPHAAVLAHQHAPGPKTAAYSKEDLAVSQQGSFYRAQKSLEVLNFKVGFAKDVQYALPEEVTAFVIDQTTLCLYGVDKNQVTQIGSNIRRIRPPEPYKGAGIRIVGESIKLKERKVKK